MAEPAEHLHPNPRAKLIRLVEEAKEIGEDRAGDGPVDRAECQEDQEAEPYRAAAPRHRGTGTGGTR